MKTLYIIKANHYFVKIGVTTNLKKRMSDIQTSCPFPITVERVYYNFNVHDYRKIEKAVHTEFNLHRLEGEWFVYTENFENKVHEYIIQNYTNINFEILNKPVKRKKLHKHN